MIYILVENTKYGANARAFQDETARDKHLNALLDEYSKEYDQPIDTIEALIEVTMDQVWVDLFETELEAG